jgi:hypothetical protein
MIPLSRSGAQADRDEDAARTLVSKQAKNDVIF